MLMTLTVEDLPLCLSEEEQGTVVKQPGVVVTESGTRAWIFLAVRCLLVEITEVPHQEQNCRHVEGANQS